MAIAIKELNENDAANFKEFLNTQREKLPDLKFSSLVPPHEDMAVIAFKKKNNQAAAIKNFSKDNCFVYTEYAENIVSLSRHKPETSINQARYLFSGYVFYNKKMLIGTDEVAREISDIESLRECCGEYCICTIENGKISLQADYFGMVPWFYFENDEVFAASNHYHLLLLLVSGMKVKLEMNLARSRVNIITTGFTYGSSFSKDLDVKGCKMNFAFEEITYSALNGVRIGKTSLWHVVNDETRWDEEAYERCIFAAKEELYEYCKAVFEHPRFTKIVVDISGGFDSRVVFATANSLPKKLRRKMYTFTRKSGTPDDIKIANSVTNLYDYPKYTYSPADTSNLFDVDGKINLAHVSRNLGLYSVCSYLYSTQYYDKETLEITGYLGEVILGYKRCRGELDYSLGDKRLLARLGGSYWWNSVKELQQVFEDQESIINETLKNYECDCLFKKFQALYIDSRNRFICNSSHNVENNNMRIPMLFSKNALKAKWLYFSKFKNNSVPDEKVSVDLLNAINPLLSALPFAESNNDVIPKPENLLNPFTVEIHPDFTIKSGPEASAVKNLYKEKVIGYMDDLHIVEQMVLQIYDYSKDYYPVCLALYKMIEILKERPEEIKTLHSRETIRKVYDIFYQIRIVDRRG